MSAVTHVPDHDFSAPPAGHRRPATVASMIGHGVAELVRAWRAGRREAAARRVLARLSPELLADIGITPDRRWEAETSLAERIRYL